MRKIILFLVCLISIGLIAQQHPRNKHKGHGFKKQPKEYKDSTVIQRDWGKQVITWRIVNGDSIRIHKFK